MELIEFAFADVWFLSTRALELANMKAALRRPDYLQFLLSQIAVRELISPATSKS